MGNLEYKDYTDKDKKLCKSLAGYTLGIVGCVLSFIACFFMSLIVFFFRTGVFKQNVTEAIEKFIYKTGFLVEFYNKIDMLINNIFDTVNTFLVLMIIGFILGLIGTILSWFRASFLSASIMIIGGLFSIISLVFPGIFLIIGGVLNIKCAKKNSNLNIN